MFQGFRSSFRLRLFAEGDVELDDDVEIVPPLDLKLVKQAFQPPDPDQDEKFMVACEEGRRNEVEKCLR